MLKAPVLTFMAAVRCGSVRAAASRLGIAQSAVSRQIQALEHELGTAVIERGSRGIRLTEAGGLLYRRAHEVSSRIDRFRSELDHLRGRDAGHVQVCSIESLASDLLPSVLAAFHRLHPLVTVGVTVATTQPVLRQVMDGLASFGLCFSATPVSGIRIVARYAEPLLAVVPNGHPLAGRPAVGIADLQPYGLAVSTRSTGAGLLIGVACRQAGVPVSVALETNSTELICRFVGQGSGVGIMTRHSCALAAGAGELTTIPLRGDAFKDSTIDLVTAPGRVLPLPAERLMGDIQARLGAGAPAGGGLPAPC